MTEYTRIRNELTALGWRPEQGNGDHVKFRKEGSERYIVVSMSLSKASSAYDNCIADIRRKEPLFSLKRPSGWTPKVSAGQDGQAPEPARAEPCPAPAAGDRTAKRRFGWIRIGERVELRSDRTIHTVTGIGSADGIHVLEETDIVTLASDQGVSYAFPEDIDSVKTMKCVSCGRYRPMNLFSASFKSEEKRCTCADCLEQRTAPSGEMAETEMKQIKTDNDMNDNQTSQDEALTPSEKEKLKDFPETCLRGAAIEIANRAAAEMTKGNKVDLRSMTPRQADRLHEKKANEIIAKIQNSLRNLDFDRVPPGLIVAKAMELLHYSADGNGGPTVSTEPELLADILSNIPEEMFRTEAEKRGYAPAQEETPAAQPIPSLINLANYTAVQLHDELKRRGYAGDMKRIVEEVLS